MTEDSSEHLRAGLEISKEHRITVFMVDDQPIFAHAVREMLKDQDDIVFHYCQDPKEAVSRAIELQPTVILQDLQMPDIDGMALLREYRMTNELRNIPKVVLSTEEKADVKAEAFSLGANDYLVKLPEKIELLARIRYHSGSYIHLLERNDAYEKLQQSKRILVAELEEAVQYVTAALPQPITGEVSTEWKYIPCQHLGGDAFGYHWLDDENFAMYVIDACGHGVGAALLSITVMNVLRSQSLPDTDFYDPKNVLKSLNAYFPMESHQGMFFTIWYGIYNKKKREIYHSCGGHHPAILVTGDSPKECEVDLLKTPGLVIGAMEDSEFENATTVVKKFGELYLFSDGAFELLKPDGTYVQYNDFVSHVAVLSKAGEADIRRILAFSNDERGEQAFEDDYALVKVTFHSL
ncbi:MAG: sigma-B regulation protein RsbU (phosphoserine phosphatase) [Chlamydiales bacterium]|jgi:sigma-B regulation protein RsbU (phosphoserine phosphatase)